MKTKTTTTKAAPATPAAPVKSSKLDQLVAQLSQPGGATPEQLMAETGWQAHSVRGALAGSLKKRGHSITSEKVGGVRRYAIERIDAK